MTNDEINRAVAVALGWIPMEGEIGRGWFQIGTTLKAPPHWQFTTDPAAADLVRREIEWRGWGLRLDYPCVGIVGEEERAWWAYVWSETIHDCPFRAGSPHMALCLAFLAAVEAEKEVSDDIQ